MARSIEIELSAEEIVKYMVSTGSSIRKTATFFGCSKTLIWKKVTEYEGDLKDDLNRLKTSNKIKSYDNVIKRGNNNGTKGKENHIKG